MEAGLNVLVVEDRPALRVLIGGYLSQRGFAVDEVTRSDDAIAPTAVNSYDAIILDLGLPDVDGLELLAQQGRADTNTSHRRQCAGWCGGSGSGVRRGGRRLSHRAVRSHRAGGTTASTAAEASTLSARGQKMPLMSGTPIGLRPQIDGPQIHHA